jgi:hypothetical protein
MTGDAVSSPPAGHAVRHPVLHAGEQRVLAHVGTPNRALAAVTLVLALGLILWIIFLGFTLPPRYDATHWQLLWIGYDAAEVAVLGFVAWAAWFRRQILAAAALVTAVLLFSDAWFDIVTSWGHRDQWMTLATGLAVEIPLAIFFVWLYRRVVMRSLAAFHEVAHDGVVTSRLVDSPFVFTIPGEDAVSSGPPADDTGHEDAADLRSGLDS